MVKAKAFWEYLCNELDYRFFAGVPCRGLKPLYDTMSSEFMHYIPAVNERVAVGIVSGAQLAGVKSAILIDMDNIYSVYDLIFNFNNVYKIPFLIIVYKSKNNKIDLNKPGFDIPYKLLNKTRYKSDLKKFTEIIEGMEVPGVIIIKGGLLG